MSRASGAALRTAAISAAIRGATFARSIASRDISMRVHAGGRERVGGHFAQGRQRLLQPDLNLEQGRPVARHRAKRVLDQIRDKDRGSHLHLLAHAPARQDPDTAADYINCGLRSVDGRRQRPQGDFAQDDEADLRVFLEKSGRPDGNAVAQLRDLLFTQR